MQRTRIFRGSFNPIHNGHIALAQQLRKEASLDEVWLMVSPQNPLKQESALLADHLRFMMAQKAVEDIEGIVASDFEFHLPKPSYTWHTLLALSQHYPDREFVLMIGGDNWAHFTGKISCVSMMWLSIRAMNILVQLMQSSTPCRVRRFVNGYVRVSQWLIWCRQPLNTWWWSIIVSGYSCRYQSCPSDGR